MSIDGRGGFGLAERMRARLKLGIALVSIVAVLGWWLWRAGDRLDQMEVREPGPHRHASEGCRVAAAWCTRHAITGEQ